MLRPVKQTVSLVLGLSLPPGGQLGDFDSVLTHLAWEEKPALAAFLRENCLNEFNTFGVDWSRHIETAVENSQSHLVKLLVSQFYLCERPEQDSFGFLGQRRKSC